jgi:hypothetical protein
MGEILWGFLYARKARWRHAKETEKAVPLSLLPEPYGRHLL